METIAEKMEFINQLIAIEDLLFENIIELNQNCPVWLARKKL